MKLINEKAETVSVVLSNDDINQALAAFIREDLLREKQPTSYRVPATACLLNEDVADDESCIVVALPGYLSTEVPATTGRPSATVTTLPNDKRIACILLRDQRVALPTHVFGFPESIPRRMLFLYMFDNGLSLDIVRCSGHLAVDIWMSQMGAQSHAHPSYAELVSDFGLEVNAFPIEVMNNKFIEIRV